MNPNRKAFLDMIAHSEGTPQVPGGDNGYNVIVGGTLFTSYADHPRKLIKINEHLQSTAAGRYQLLAGYFTVYKRLLKLVDFSPASQDAIAVQQIRESRALDDVDAGRFDDAVKKCAPIWASLPGSGYGQHENSLTSLEKEYEKDGGTISE